MSDEKIEDAALIQLRGLRREIAAVLENQQVMSKNIARLYEQIQGVGTELRAFKTDVSNELSSLKSDVLTLEMQNMSRHGETLSILRRLEGIDD